MIDRDELHAHPERYFQVCAEQCNECLFTKHRVVGSRRMKEVIDGAVAGDSYFICHKHSLRVIDSDGELTAQHGSVCCRAYFDTFGRDVLVVRLARMLGRVVFVDLNGEPLGQEEAVCLTHEEPRA
jgi:hypothetical protein